VKKIGIVGGTAWPSTVHYYTLICRQAEERFGVTPEFAIESLDLRLAVSLIGNDHDDRSWDAFDSYHREGLLRVSLSGCNVACFAANTPHHRFEQITGGVPVHVVSIISSVAQAAIKNDCRKLLLIGTRLTMTSAFIRRTFSDAGVEVVLPSDEGQLAVIDLIERLQQERCDNAGSEITRLTGGLPVILGCTELALAFPNAIGDCVFDYNDSVFFNSLAIHAAAVLNLAAA